MSLLVDLKSGRAESNACVCVIASTLNMDSLLAAAFLLDTPATGISGMGSILSVSLNRELVIGVFVGTVRDNEVRADDESS